MPLLIIIADYFHFIDAIDADFHAIIIISRPDTPLLRLRQTLFQRH
jgi:hypothetical protein